MTCRKARRMNCCARVTPAFTTLPPHIRSAPSRAVVPALGQEMPRTMGHFQVRKWQRAHRALCEKALAHPLHREGYDGGESPAITPSVSSAAYASNGMTPSCAVETALSSPQSPQVRRCVPRGLTARLASPLPTHLLRICAGALKRRAQCAVFKFASGKEPTGLFARKHLLTPQEGAFVAARRFGLRRASFAA